MSQLQKGARWRRVRSARGVELIEFAITLPILLFVLSGIIDFGFLFHHYEIVTNAAREGARMKSNLTTASLADVQERVGAYLDNAGLVSGQATTAVNPVAIPINPSGTVTAAGNQVVVQYPFQFRTLAMMNVFFGGSFGTVTLTASAMMRNE